MADIILYIECEDYLREWIIDYCGGTIPARIRKNSPESSLLEATLQKRQEGSFRKPSPSDLQIIIPVFRSKPPEFYNYLSPAGRTALLKVFRRHFDYQLWHDLMPLSGLLRRKDELIVAWMDAHGISDTEKNTLAVTKRLQRIRDRTLAAARMKNKRKKL